MTQKGWGTGDLDDGGRRDLPDAPLRTAQIEVACLAASESWPSSSHHSCSAGSTVRRRERCQATVLRAPEVRWAPVERHTDLITRSPLSGWDRDQDPRPRRWPRPPAITSGQVGDPAMLASLLSRLPVRRLGRGRPGPPPTRCLGAPERSAPAFVVSRDQGGDPAALRPSRSPHAPRLGRGRRPSAVGTETYKGRMSPDTCRDWARRLAGRSQLVALRQLIDHKPPRGLSLEVGDPLLNCDAAEPAKGRDEDGSRISGRAQQPRSVAWSVVSSASRQALDVPECHVD